MSHGVIGISEAILIDAPPEIAADLLADFVGNDILPGTYWIKMLEETGFADIIARESQVEMRKESRSQLGFFSVGDYLGLLWNMLKVTFGRDPFVRNLAKRSWSTPRGFYDFLAMVCWLGGSDNC